MNVIERMKALREAKALEPVIKAAPAVVNPVSQPEQIGGLVIPNGITIAQVMKADDWDSIVPHSDLDELRRVADLITLEDWLRKSMRPLAWKPGQWKNYRTAQKYWFGSPGNVGVNKMITEIRKAVDTGSQPGQDWVFSGFTDRVAEIPWRKTVLAPFFQINDIPDGMSSMQVPIHGGRVVAVLGTENTADTAALITVVDTDDDTYTATPIKLETRTTISMEYLEDQAPRIEGLMAEIEDAQALALERAILNGTDDGTHFDDDTDGGAATLAEKAFDGLHHDALDTTAPAADTADNAGGPMTKATVRAMWKEVGQDWANPRDQLLVVAHQQYVDLLGDADNQVTEASFETVSFADGNLRTMYGYRGVVISPACRGTDVSATGADTAGGPNTFGRAWLGNVNAWELGRKRAMEIMVEKVVGSDAVYMTSTQRVSFNKAVRLTEETSCTGINISA